MPSQSLIKILPLPLAQRHLFSDDVFSRADKLSLTSNQFPMYKIKLHPTFFLVREGPGLRIFFEREWMRGESSEFWNQLHWFSSNGTSDGSDSYSCSREIWICYKCCLKHRLHACFILSPASKNTAQKALGSISTYFAK